MTHLRKQELIEKFLTGSLTSAEHKEFQKLQSSDSSLQEDIDFFKRFMNVQKIYGRDELKKELAFLETQLQKEEAPSLLAKLNKSLQGITKKLHYSLEELSKLFRAEPEYQRILVYANRGGELQVLSPQNGIDASIEGLNFQLKTDQQYAIQLTIENNQKQVLYSTTIDSQTPDFRVDVEELIPGRYYWKLSSQKETIIREFFIQKNLMKG